MDLIYRPIDHWPGPFTSPRKPPPFRATWADTLKLLGHELEMLDVEEAVLQLALLTESDLRVDGSIKVRAVLRHPGVILSFKHPAHGDLSYPCDTFDGGSVYVNRRERRDRLLGWQVNVRAVALGLGALRQVDRYGIAGRGEQYAGWRAIGAGTPAPKMTAEEAARFIVAQAWPDDDAGQQVGQVLVSDEVAKKAYRAAAKALHPDAGAFDEDKFKSLQEAWRVLRPRTESE